MSRSDSKEIGSLIEELLCDRYGWEHIDGALSEPDARHPSGRPIEIKAARDQISDGSRDRSGRFYLRERAHRALLDRGGDYCLAVYRLDPDPAPDAELLDQIEILSTVILPARYLDSMIGSWSSVDRAGADAVSKVAHSSIGVLPEGVR